MLLEKVILNTYFTLVTAQVYSTEDLQQQKKGRHSPSSSRTWHHWSRDRIIQFYLHAVTQTCSTRGPDVEKQYVGHYKILVQPFGNIISVPQLKQCTISTNI